MIIGAVLGSLLALGCLLVGIWALICCCCGGAGAGGGTCGTFGYSNGGRVSGGACSDLLGYPTQTVSRSLRRKYAPAPSGGPEDMALSPCTAAASEAGPSRVYVKVTSAEPADCAQGSLPGKDGLLV